MPLQTNSALPVNTFPKEVRDDVISTLTSVFHKEVISNDFKIVSGGCINHGGLLKTTVGDFFIKWNDANQFPKMFEAEKSGLLLLAKTKTIRTPEVIAVTETERYQFIILQFIKSSKHSNTFWEDFGCKLAGLHQCSDKFYGLDYDNYIGSLKQYNRKSLSWLDFFKVERISQQLLMAERSGLTDHSLRQKFDILFNKLPDLLPIQKPVLIHGDLWGGNVISDDLGNPCLIDPAVYFGTSEMEISYTRLFGGFNERFYEAYNAVTPLAPGFKERMDIYNLYPLLVHVNLFGRSYLSSIEGILNRFI